MTDAEREARKSLLSQMATPMDADAERYIDAYADAVVARCIAVVEGMDAHVAADDRSLFLWRDDILAALRRAAGK